SGTVKLLRCGETRGAAPDNCHAVASACFRRFWKDPTFGPATIHDRSLDTFDRDRICVASEDTSWLARRGTCIAGELREIVCRVQAVEGSTPVPPGNQIIEIRYNVSNRTAPHARRHSTIHA